jgi:hypothetical protein
MYRLVGGLLLALVSAAAINLGFLYQHRGLHERRLGAGPWAALRGALSSRAWMGGQVLGWLGFGAQIVAVTIAPLSLVQAFAAGGLVLSVPMASGLFAYRVSRGQILAVTIGALALAVLPTGLHHGGEHLRDLPLVVSVMAVLAVGVATGLARPATLRAIAAGLLYGVADAAIKAVSVSLHGHPNHLALAGWTGLAILGTFGGFLTFQAALGSGGAITAISLMNMFAALVALGCGLLGFGESLGATPLAVLVHVAAIGVVLACVPALAAAQAQIADQPARDHTADREHHTLHPGTGAR